MRIAVANLTSGGLSGGYRKYLERLMPLIAHDPRVKRLIVFIPAGAGVEIDPAVDVRTWSPQDAARPFASLVRDVAALAPDLVFVPTARHADFGSIPVVTMVHNMEPLTVPFAGHTWTEGLKNVARAWAAGRACRRAARVIAVSHHVRDVILTRWHIDPDRIGTVHHGVDRPDVVSGAKTRQAKTLFTAGSIRPARGLEDVLRALALVDGDVRLVIAGRVDPGCEGYAERLRTLAKDPRVAGRVTWVGQLGPTEMTRAFQSSTIFIMTSRAESCPMTALEAMSCGCPTVSADRAPMPEIFGDAAVYYPIGDAQALAHQLRTLIDNQTEQDRLCRAASSRAATFTWDATRERTIQELERTLS